LFKITLLDEKPSNELVAQLKQNFATQNNISLIEAAYFVFKGKIKNQAYNKEKEPIKILKKDKTVENIDDSSDQLQLKALSKSVTKYYICYPKALTDYKN
jgi:Na+-translocating ferredoxin:NAD+ oxidoreductase RnfG subunit